jgi:hypothetical protein
MNGARLLGELALSKLICVRSESSAVSKHAKDLAMIESQFFIIRANHIRGDEGLENSILDITRLRLENLKLIR